MSESQPARTGSGRVAGRDSWQVEFTEDLEQEFDFTQAAGAEDRNWTGSATHKGKNHRVGTVDGTYSDWTEDAANNVIPGTLNLSYSSAGSDILDTFDAQINAVTTPAGEGQGQASTSGSDSGILNQVHGGVAQTSLWMSG